jgi:glycosyltransferase involved in cell wall biosynthesis
LVVNITPEMGNVARTISESVAMGTPVMSTTLEGLNNIIESGLNGDIVETNNAVDLAQKIVKTYTNMPTNVSETLPKEFTLAALADSTIEVYQDVIVSKKLEQNTNQRMKNA